MTPEIHEKYQKIKTVTEMLAPTLAIFRIYKLEEFPKEARIFSNGTLTPILLHSLSMNDLNTSENNLKKGIKVCELLDELCTLLGMEVLEENQFRDAGKMVEAET